MPSSVLAKALVQAFEDAHELGFHLEDFDDGIVPEFLEILESYVASRYAASPRGVQEPALPR